MGAWEDSLRKLREGQTALHTCNDALARTNASARDRLHAFHLEEDSIGPQFTTKAHLHNCVATYRRALEARLHQMVQDARGDCQRISDELVAQPSNTGAPEQTEALETAQADVDALEAQVAVKRKGIAAKMQEVERLEAAVKQKEAQIVELKLAKERKEAVPAQDGPDAMHSARLEAELERVEERARQLERQADLLEQNGAQPAPPGLSASDAARDELEAAQNVVDKARFDNEADVGALDAAVQAHLSILQNVARACGASFDRQADLEALKRFGASLERGSSPVELDAATRERLRALGISPKASEAPPSDAAA